MTPREAWRDQWEHLCHAYLGDDRLLQAILACLREGREINGEICLPLETWRRLVDALDEQWRDW